MRFFIETNLGFDHGDLWCHNINFDALYDFDNYEEALERQKELLELPDVKWAEIRQG